LVFVVAVVAVVCAGLARFFAFFLPLEALRDTGRLGKSHHPTTRPPDQPTIHYPITTTQGLNPRRLRALDT
jgi:hypothetical protein